MITPEQAEALRKPFSKSAIGKLPRSTKSDNPKGRCTECKGFHGLPAVHLDYVGHAGVTDRLLSVDPCWTWEPLALDESGLPLMRSTGRTTTLWIRLTVCGVTRLGVGSVESNAFDVEKQLIGDCVASGTLIATPAGPVPVEALRRGASVATRSGWRPVAEVWKAHDRARFLRLLLSDGSTLSVTAGHRMFRADGSLCYASDLRNGDILYSWLDLLQHLHKSSSSTESSTVGTSDDGITSAGTAFRSEPFIGRYGNPTTARYHRASTSTTRTVIPMTTVSRISWHSRLSSTSMNMPMTIEGSRGCVNVAECRTEAGCHGGVGALLRARRPPAALPGSTRRPVAALYAGGASPSRGSRPPEPAGRHVPFYSMPDQRRAPSAESFSWLRGPGVGSAPLYVVAVLDGGTGTAWDIEVEDRHEFLAGPVLTHNSLRNAAMRFGVALDLWDKAELESQGEEESHPTAALAHEATATGLSPAGKPICVECKKAIDAGARRNPDGGGYVHRTCPEGSRDHSPPVPSGEGGGESQHSDSATAAPLPPCRLCDHAQDVHALGGCTSCTQCPGYEVEHPSDEARELHTPPEPRSGKAGVRRARERLEGAG